MRFNPHSPDHGNLQANVPLLVARCTKYLQRPLEELGFTKDNRYKILVVYFNYGHQGQANINAAKRVDQFDVADFGLGDGSEQREEEWLRTRANAGA